MRTKVKYFSLSSSCASISSEDIPDDTEGVVHDEDDIRVGAVESITKIEVEDAKELSPGGGGKHTVEASVNSLGGVTSLAGKALQYGANILDVLITAFLVLIVLVLCRLSSEERDLECRCGT